MKNEILINKFVGDLRNHALQKEGMYDNADRAGRNLDTKFDTKYCIALAIEELGEVAAAHIRNRHLLAKYECLDVAHAAMLIWISLQDNVE